MMKKLDDEKRRQMILGGGIGKILITLAVPTLMMSLVQSLIPLSDGLFINNVAGTLVASAVTFCNPVISLATALAVGLSAAAMAVIGQTFGRGDFSEVRRVSTQTVVFGFSLGLCIIPVMIVLAFPISAYVTPEISDNVRLYIMLYAFVLPFSFMESIYNGIMNATGRPEKPFVRMVIMLMLKVAFNVVFIVWLRLGIVGCVLATFSANVAVCIWMFYELFLVKSSMQLTLKGFRFDRRIIHRLVKIGVPSMLTQMIMSLGFVLINNETQKYGAIVLNGQGIANSITSVCYNVPSAFGSAVTTMVSMNMGSGNVDRARKSTFWGCGFAAAAAVVIIAVVVPVSGHLTVLFTREPEVLEIANRALKLYAYSVVGFGICAAVQGAMIGLGRTKVPLVLGFLRIWLLRYVFILCTESFLAYYSVFWGNLFSNCVAAVIFLIFLAKMRWKVVN